MAEWWEWTGEPGPWESNAAPDLWAGGSPTFNEAGGGVILADERLPISNLLAGAIRLALARVAIRASTGEGSGGCSAASLGGAGAVAVACSAVAGGGGIGGPLLSALGSLGGGAIGSNAANEAARLQSQALNRGIDLQTAQWLQQQQNLAPYLQAGQGGLAQLQQLAGREQPTFQDPAAAISGANYALPSTTPGWTPTDVPGTARAERRGLSLDARAGTAGRQLSLHAGADIPTRPPIATRQGRCRRLSGQELLANDPGVAFRMAEGRKALEASAAAKGGLLSGPTLAALQRQGQELSSQEYGNAWNRASQQAQLREQWGAGAPRRWAGSRPRAKPACGSRSIR